MLDLACYLVVDQGPRVAVAVALASWYGAVAVLLLGRAGPYRD